jgi:thiamine transporter ThiT
MIRRIAVNARPLPLSLNLTDARVYGLIAVFVALSVFTPWLFHQFRLAGATFLPMHIFVFVAALTVGWQAGLLVGVLTPLASFVVSGMPVAVILPQVIIEVTAYGLIAGLLRQKLNLRVAWSVLGAMAGGRVVLLLTMVAIYYIGGAVASPIGAESGPLASFWHTVAQAWPGILIQAILIPAAFWAASRLRR